MAFGEVGYAEQRSAGALLPVEGTVPTTLERLSKRKQHLESELENINRALDALKTNPEVARVVEALARVAY